MLAYSTTSEIAAPLDIAWVWHVHMLSPVNYERDCNEIASTLLDHKILVGEQRQKGLIKAKALWEKLYPRKPFEVDLTAPVNNAPGFKSRLEYDIAAACTRQRVFYYQVSSRCWRRRRQNRVMLTTVLYCLRTSQTKERMFAFF